MTTTTCTEGAHQGRVVFLKSQSANEDLQKLGQEAGRSREESQRLARSHTDTHTHLLTTSAIKVLPEAHWGTPGQTSRGSRTAQGYLPVKLMNERRRSKKL